MAEYLREGFWVVGDNGEEEFMAYEDLDTALISQVLRPVGGFCYSAEDFKRLPLASAPFYIEGWLPKPGKMIVYGRGKVGKSFLALQLARCIGSGEPFLGIGTSQGRVLYLQFEIGMAILQHRLWNTGKAYPDVFVGTSFAMKLDTRGGLDQLTRAVGVVHPNVVILDPFYKMFQGEENQSHDVQIVFDNLDTIIEAFNCSIVVFHHGGKDLERGGRGSSVFEDWCDAYVEVKKNQDKIRVTPKMLRHAELPPEPIDAILDNFEFRVVDRTPTIKEKVAEWVKAKGQTTINEMLLAELGSKRAIYSALTELASEGVVVKFGKGGIGLTPQITT